MICSWIALGPNALLSVVEYPPNVEPMISDGVASLVSHSQYEPGSEVKVGLGYVVSSQGLSISDLVLAVVRSGLRILCQYVSFMR